MIQIFLPDPESPYALLVSANINVHFTVLYGQPFSSCKPFWDKYTYIMTQNNTEHYTVTCNPYMYMRYGCSCAPNLILFYSIARRLHVIVLFETTTPPPPTFETSKATLADVGELVSLEAHILHPFYSMVSCISLNNFIHVFINFICQNLISTCHKMFRWKRIISL